MFKIGDYIIYGSNGVCEITDIGPMEFGGEKKTYYTMVPYFARESKIFTLVNNDKILMRENSHELQQEKR